MPRTSPDPLLDHQIRQLAPAAKPRDVRDGHTHGLIVTVLPSGRRQFAIRYRFQGKQRRLILGDYPALTLAKARRAAEAARVAIRTGRDPVGERAARKARRTDTVRALSAVYLEEHASRKADQGAEDRRVLDVYVLPEWADRSVREIRRRDVKELLRPIAKRAPVMANRVFEIVRKMFNFAIAEEWLDGNPAARLPKPGGPEVSRDRVLTDDEIRALWALLERFPTTPEKQAPGRPRAAADADGRAFCPISPALAAAEKLRLLTAQRGGEVIAMTWDDLDLAGGWWTIPAERAKNRRLHRVPLSDDARTLIEAQEPDEDQRTGLVFHGREGASVADRVTKAGADLSAVLGFAFRSHDLRRTAATRMAALGVPPAHISAVLNHVQGGPIATRTYLRHEFDAEKRAALDRWALELRRIVASAPSSSRVLPMGSRRR